MPAPDYASPSWGQVRELILEAQNQPAARRVLVDARRHPRFKLAIDIVVNSRTGGRQRGHTVDISESGIAAILKFEVPMGEIVELEFTLPFGAVVIYAMVRQRNAFRYGFQFVESSGANEAIQAVCRELAMDQSLLGNL